MIKKTKAILAKHIGVSPLSLGPLGPISTKEDIEEVIADIKDIKPTVINSVSCTCSDCLSGETALQKQLNHKFYKDAEAFRNEIKMETLKKAAVKYPEPFNPFNWTVTQLGKHAMAENYDQENYIFGLYEMALELEKLLNKANADIEGLMQENEQLKKERDYWKGFITTNYGL